MSRARAFLVVGVVLVLIVGSIAAVKVWSASGRTTVSGFFASSNGLYVGDEVRILGVPVGSVDKIEPGADSTRITFSFDSSQKVPADAKAAILSPSLVSSRAIQLVPAYTDGPEMTGGAEIPEDRTAVPVEWDDFRAQLQKLSDSLVPSTPDGKSSLGAFVDTAADNLRGEGTDANATLNKLSEAVDTLGDSSTDIFSTIENLQILVSALSSSSDLMAQLNENLAAVTGLLANDPNEVSQATVALDAAIGDISQFVGDNRDNVTTTVDRLTSISQALQDSKGDIEQTLHIAPTTFQNFVNIYQPSQGALTGALAFNNFANPIQFICAGIQAAAQKGAEESAKLCAQYLAPVLKNLQVNFPPIGANLVNGAVARPNEITYSEDRLRPSGTAPESATPAAPSAAATPTPPPSPLDGIADMLIPGGGR